MTDWAKAHWLNERWLIETFIRALEWWVLYPHEKGERLWTHLPVSENLSGEEEPFRFEHPEWNYYELRKSQYRQVVEEHFKKELNIYLKRRTAQAVASGEHQVKPTRARSKIKPAIKMQWFVLYQIRGLTPKQIADRYSQRQSESVHVDQVMKAVREVAALIDLQYRRRKRGRPKRKR